MYTYIFQAILKQNIEHPIRKGPPKPLMMTKLTHRTGHTSWEDAQQRCLDNGDARLATIANNAQQVKDYLLLCFVPLSDESLLLFIREMTPTK